MTTRKREKHGATHRLEAYEWRAWPTVASTWSSLVARCEQATCFFVTTDWVQTWMDTFGEQLKPTILLFRTDPETIRGGCLLVRRSRRKGPFGVRRMYLNTASEQDVPTNCVEANTLLCEPGYELAMAVRLREYMEQTAWKRPWDELRVSGLIEGAPLEAFETAFHDLRPANDAALAGGAIADDTLDSWAPEGLSIEQPSTLHDALDCLDELLAFRGKVTADLALADATSWNAYSQFHHQLIARCFSFGDVQLFRIRAHGNTIACVCNLVFRSNAYFYQCGFEHPMSARSCIDTVAAHTGDDQYATRALEQRQRLQSAAWRAPTFAARALGVARTATARIRRYSDQVKQTVVDALQSGGLATESAPMMSLAPQRVR